MPGVAKPPPLPERPGLVERLRRPAAVAGYVAFYLLFAVLFVCAFFGGFTHPVTICLYVLMALAFALAFALNLEAAVGVFRTRKAAAGMSVTLSITAALVILAAALWLSFRHSVVFDITEDRRFSLDNVTMEWLKRLEETDGTLRLVSFLPNNPPRMSGLPRDYKAQILELLKLYARSPRIKVTNVDPIGEVRRTETAAASLGIRPGNVPVGCVVLKRGEDLKTLNAGDMFLTLPQSEPIFNGEATLTSAIRDLLDERTRKVYFVTGHCERTSGPGPRGYGNAVRPLRDMNFAVEELGLLAEKSVPADADCLVIAGPTAPFLATEIEAVEDYLARGGKLVVMLDRLDASAGEMKSGIERILAEYGVTVRQDALAVSVEMESLANRVTGTPNPSHQITSWFRDRLAVFYLSSVLEPGAPRRPGFRPAVLVWGRPGSYGERKPDEARRRYDEAEDIAGPAIFAAAVAPDTASGTAPGGGTHIVAFADADFLDNRFLSDPLLARHVNVDLFLNAVNWLVGRTENLRIRRPARERCAVTMTRSRRRRVFWGAVMGPPLLMVVLGAVVWRLRRD